jgi:hypothetical protein
MIILNVSFFEEELIAICDHLNDRQAGVVEDSSAGSA